MVRKERRRGREGGTMWWCGWGGRGGGDTLDTEREGATSSGAACDGLVELRGEEVSKENDGAGGEVGAEGKGEVWEGTCDGGTVHDGIGCSKQTNPIHCDSWKEGGEDGVQPVSRRAMEVAREGGGGGDGGDV